MLTFNFTLLFDVLVEGGAGHSSCFHGVCTTSMLYVHYHVVQWQIEGAGFSVTPSCNYLMCKFLFSVHYPAVADFCLREFRDSIL